MKRFFLYFLLAATLLSLDIASKYFIYHDLLPTIMRYPRAEGIPLFRNWMGIDFFIGLTFNKGAAWGILANMQTLLLAIRIAVVCALFVYLVRQARQGVHTFALLLILIGAIGNIFDFFLYGFVIDFFHFRFWGHSFPLFNIADALISIGVALLFLNLRRKKHARI